MANPFFYASGAYGQPLFGGTTPQPTALSMMVFADVRTLQANDPRLLTTLAEQREQTAQSSSPIPAPIEQRIFS